MKIPARVAPLVPAFLLIALATAWAFERPEIHFDKRTWKVGHQSSKGDQTMVEFVLENESVGNWSELVTTQLFAGLQEKMSVAEYVAAMHKSIGERCPKVKWNTIRSGDTDAVYEWSVSACSGVADQSEIARVFKGLEGIHIVHYAMRKPDMPAASRKEWLGLLERARLLI